MAVLIARENNVMYRIRDLTTIAEIGIGNAKMEKDTLGDKPSAKKAGTKYIFSSVLSPCMRGVDRRKSHERFCTRYYGSGVLCLNKFLFYHDL